MPQPPKKTARSARSKPPDPFVAETLARLDGMSDTAEVRCRAMFGGYGIYLGATFFGIGHRGRLFFRVDDRTRPEYQRLGGKPFRPSAKVTMQAYFEVPAEVLDDPDELCAWAQESAALAAALAQARGRKKRRS